MVKIKGLKLQLNLFKNKKNNITMAKIHQNLL